MLKIDVYENISTVTFNDIPADSSAMTDIFKKTADAGINIDMISMAAPTSDIISFGFTFSDNDIAKLLAVLKGIKEAYSTTPLVNSGNCKLVIKAHEMIEQAGFASKVFLALEAVKAQALLITTGIDEISVLIRSSDETDVINKIKEVFA